MASDREKRAKERALKSIDVAVKSKVQYINVNGKWVRKNGRWAKGYSGRRLMAAAKRAGQIVIGTRGGAAYFTFAAKK